MKTHRQPARPAQSMFSRIQREIGMPTAMAMGCVTMKYALARGAVFDAVPVREVDDDAREKSRFRNAEQQPQTVELRHRAEKAEQRSAQKAHQRGHQSPGDHDARDPFASAPALHNQAAWNIEQQ